MAATTLLLIITAVIVGLLSFLVHLLTRRRGDLENLGIPMVKPGLLTGSPPLDVHNYNMEREQLETFKRLKTKSYGMYEGTQPIVMTVDPEIIKAVTVKHFDSFLEIIDMPIKDHQLTLDVSGGEVWRSLRKNLSPTFTSGKLKKMLQPMTKVAEKMIERINEDIKKGEEVQDLKILYQGMTLDAIARCAYGVEVDTYNAENELVKHGRNAFAGFVMKSMKDTIIYQILTHLPQLTGVVGSVLPPEYKHLHRITRDIIAARRRESLHDDSFISRLMDLLDRLKNEPDHEDMKSLNEDIIISQGIVFFVAGFETTANALSTLSYVLATKPEIQNRLYEEISGVLEHHGDKLDSEAIEELSYLDAVINENLRMHPPATLHIRLCTKDCEVKPGMVIKKGTRVDMSIYSGHYMEEFFSEPEEFRPERFMKDADNSDVNNLAKDPFVFRPFGSGTRLCIGQRFALIEMKLALATLLKEFELQAVPETKLEFNKGSPFMISFPEVRVKLVPRNKNSEE